jgi:hypothetical protein
MGRSSGAGSPVYFKCSNCRGRNYFATGKTRHQGTPKGHAAGTRSHSDTAFEYGCKDCKHVGWSRHKDVWRRYELIFGKL